MKRLSSIWSVSVLWLCATMVSCVGTAPMKEVHLVDSLNRAAYTYRYKDLDSSCDAASSAYKEAGLYKSGKAEACNNLGFCAFMRMDFERAVKWHQEVYDLTKNEPELLIADIGLMKIYQRTASNKEFFDYRNSALRRMKRIAEDSNLFVDRRERLRLSYARSEFYIVSAIYCYYLRQRQEAMACIHKVPENEELVADTNQLLYYHYIKGSAALCEGEKPDNQRLSEFDELYTTWSLASRKGYLYFEGNGIQGIANLMATPDNYEFFRSWRSPALKRFGMPVDSLLPMRLGQLALRKFRQYKDLYQIAGTYVSIGKYLNVHGRYAEALDTLRIALECVNDHHRRFYDGYGSQDGLKVYNRGDTVCTEKVWMEHKLRIVPEWVSRIREQLSVSYAGLEMKEKSDYNRNRYLDILEDTRQDKELESRYLALEKESNQLNALLFFIISGFVLVVLFFWFFNKRSKAKNELHLHRLRAMLDICQKITAAIPADAQAEEEITGAIQSAIAPEMEDLLGIKDICIENRQWVLPQRMGKDELAMVKVITPYIQWALDNGMISISLGDERRKLEKQRYIYEQHIAGSKRQNLIKKACMSIVNGVHPYIDRIINEVGKLAQKGFIKDKDIKKEKYQYIDELVTTINEYNDILALWIRMKQGTLSLNIETFGLNELFELLRKGSHAFDMKQQRLEVTPTDAYVKADKSLTLFMINTLAENARKYTPQGGTVKIYARLEKDYVEISVEDNGRGLSPEDVARIVGEKVYDSKSIGMNDATGHHREELRENKGIGFGLMNCKGIIEKYRKMNDLFKVCLFSVESIRGKGSRFYFRLPAGIRKALTLCFLCLSLGVSSCDRVAETVTREEVPAYVAWAAARNEYEAMLNTASDFANQAYYSNIDGHYELALQFVDSAMYCLNAHYEKYAPSPHRFMTLTGDGQPAELDWWNELFNSDFHVILDIRNEAAVAFLALKQWENYSYNNMAYVTLYKLLGEDRSLAEYCRRLERSSNNKSVGISLGVILVLFLLLGYYILYIRKRLVNRWNLEQVLEINKQVFDASLPPASETEETLQREEALLKGIPPQIVNAAFDAVNELLSIDRMGIAVYNESAHRLEYTSNPSEDAGEEEELPRKDFMRRCFAGQAYLAEMGMQALPLVVDVGGSSSCIGVLCLERREGTERESDRLLLELIARYVGIVIFNSVIKLATQYRDIETAQDEARRASREDSVLHVQNMVLDNCLSAIKHETIYYPNKIKLLIGKLRSGRLTETEERETVAAIGELIEYYKGIFTILSSCASRQLEEVTFRRSEIAVTDLLNAAEKYFRKASKRTASHLTFQTGLSDETVIGDVNQLRFLLENLIDEAVSVPIDGAISLHTAVDGAYVRFIFTDTRVEKTREELNQLFYPDLSRMTAGDRGNLNGTEHLVCKQIIRDHDEFVGRRGCRINAEPGKNAGYAVYFTILRKRSADRPES